MFCLDTKGAWAGSFLQGISFYWEWDFRSQGHASVLGVLGSWGLGVLGSWGLGVLGSGLGVLGSWGLGVWSWGLGVLVSRRRERLQPLAQVRCPDHWGLLLNSRRLLVKVNWQWLSKPVGSILVGR